MKSINADRKLNSILPDKATQGSHAITCARNLGLRAKFVLFFSLILVIACSTLSWYYVVERREAMARQPPATGNDSPHERGPQ